MPLSPALLTGCLHRSLGRQRALSTPCGTGAWLTGVLRTPARRAPERRPPVPTPPPCTRALPCAATCAGGTSTAKRCGRCRCAAFEEALSPFLHGGAREAARAPAITCQHIVCACLPSAVCRRSKPWTSSQSSCSTTSCCWGERWLSLRGSVAKAASLPVCVLPADVSVLQWAARQLAWVLLCREPCCPHGRPIACRPDRVAQAGLVRGRGR